MEIRTCSFTGHRLIKPEHYGHIDELLMRAIEYVYSHGCRVFYCGGALGFDTLAAKQVLKFRLTHPDVQLRLLLPCKNQTEGWTDSQVHMYEYVMSNAAEIIFLSDDYYPNCYRDRNRQLAMLGDVIVAYLSRTTSGAGQTVRMAREEGKTVYNLFPSLDK